MSTNKIRFGKWFIIPFIGIFIFGITRLLIHYPQLAERYYSQKFYPALATVISYLSSFVPFSIDDAFYLILIISALIIIGLTIGGKVSVKRSSLIILNVLFSVYILFYVLWGFNYFRVDINNRLGLIEREANQQEFMNVFNDLIASANETYTSYDIFKEEEIAKQIEESFSRLVPILKINYPGGRRRAKPVTFSGLFAQAGISGYYGPFFNEIHINTKLLPVEFPFVLAHEKAHQFGITGEAEANFYAWLVCTQSESKQLQYSANLIALRYFIFHGKNQEGYREAIEKIDKRVLEDIRRIYQHWQSLRNDKVEAVAERMNDAYLKTNQVEKGIADYTGIVKHIMDFSLDTAFREKAGF